MRNVWRPISCSSSFPEYLSPMSHLLAHSQFYLIGQYQIEFLHWYVGRLHFLSHRCPISLLLLVNSRFASERACLWEGPARDRCLDSKYRGKRVEREVAG